MKTAAVTQPTPPGHGTGDAKLLYTSGPSLLSTLRKRLTPVSDEPWSAPSTHQHVAQSVESYDLLVHSDIIKSGQGILSL